MLIFYHFLYNLVAVTLMRGIVFFARLVSPRVAERESESRLSYSLLSALPQDTQKIWFHAASMGEFEQVKPVIESLRTQMPRVRIIVSFFSPSGYRNQKSYAFADAVVYLPLDTRRNAQRFIASFQPDIAVFVRYDTWWNYLYALHQRHIPVYLLNATYPSSRLARFPLFRGFLQTLFSLCKEIITHSPEQAKRFQSSIKHPSIVPGSDTRYDRISAIVQSATNAPLLPPTLFNPDDIVLVLGSSWQPDERLVCEALETLGNDSKRIRLIIVPHEPTEQHLLWSEALFGDIQRLSRVGNELNHRHILVDSIGKLLQLYANAHAAYIGGGFGVGVHSVSEAAGYAIPIACGSAIERNEDATHLQICGGLTIVTDASSLSKWLRDMVMNDSLRTQQGMLNKSYIAERSGSTQRFVDKIMHELQSHPSGF